MKKNIFSIFALAMLLFAASSCSKEDVGGTATVETAGDWYVTMAAVDENGEVVDEDFFGNGTFHLLTFNTAENKSTEMWVSDQEWSYYYPFKCKVTVDQATLTFKAEASPNAFYEGENVTITDGKIVKDGAVTPSGQKADYIEFYISFDDDGYPAYYEFDKYKISGYRYTGFVADE